MRGIRTLATVVCVVIGSGMAIRADVKTEQKGQMKFGGSLGRMFSMFGGKAAREGVVTRVAVKGDRMMTASDENGQLIDLAEEKVYDIGFGSKSYKVTTFDELRRRMREAEEKARQNQAKTEERQSKGEEKSGEKPPEYEIDVTTKSTGAVRAMNGFQTKQVITTITVRQKGKTVEQGGGLVLTSDNWVTPSIDAMKEVADFHLRYMKKLESPVMGAMSAEQMAAIFAMYPMLKEAMGKIRTEGEKVEGTPILTTITCDAVQDAAQAEARAQQEKKDDAPPTSAGGLGGMLARKMMKKKADDSAAASGSAPGRATVMTMVSETLSVSTDVAAGDVAVPAGFKLR
jgi:hypothetical protein